MVVGGGLAAGGFFGDFHVTAAPADNRTKAGGGKFQKGTSGNPSGRKPGTRNRATLLIESMSEDDRAAIVAKIIKQAKRGDRASQKLIVDRIEPPRKGRAAPFPLPLPPIKTTGDVVVAMEAVTSAMAAGQLSPAEAVEISAVVELQRRAIETQDVENRLHALEARFK
ncbi:DUF5681 domain-containing protein [Bradyrhizobium sp. SSUT112]|uniref:DUF5681 domain-containing protein n=1 Tax=Bradyrhizobium sp. SSUT112 TaxID=3040604 RepID=UPI00244931DF|nr:DUF5681 domain-containing protein [Bradyrhizobium sp. SSUT112]MDH2353480.1 DUF5681 domain-containing protein [Bradyrhizobium sp. SSUT112]